MKVWYDGKKMHWVYWDASMTIDGKYTDTTNKLLSRSLKKAVRSLKKTVRSLQRLLKARESVFGDEVDPVPNTGYPKACEQI